MKVLVLIYFDCNVKLMILFIINILVVMEYCESDKFREESEGLLLLLF